MAIEYATKQTATHSSLVAEAKVGSIELIEALADEWRALCAEGACDQPFFRPEWIGAYVQAFAADKKLVVFTVRRNGQLRAILPLIEERTTLHGLPIKKLRSAANAHSCRFDLIHGASDRDGTTRAIWNLLKQRNGWDVIELADVPAGGAGELLVQVALADGYRGGRWKRPPGAFLPLPKLEPLDRTSEKNLEMPISGKFRKSLRYYKRKLENRGALQFRCVENNEPGELERFYRLESSGWKGREGTAIACDEQTTQFYNDVARSAAKYGYFSLYSLEQNGQPIAMQYCLAYGKRCHLLKPAYDERSSEFSPGHLITYEVLHDLIARDFHEYDFMSPRSEWKSRWAKSLWEQSSCYIFRHDWVGRFLHAWKFRLVQRARHWKQKWQ